MLRSSALTVMFLLAAIPPGWAGYAEGVEAFARGDHVSATAEFLEDAQRGDAESAYMLGRLYALRSGTPEDWIQSWLWHDRAARLGHEEAAAARANMEAILHPTQLAQARAMAGYAGQVAIAPAPAPASSELAAQSPRPIPRSTPPRSTIIIPRD